MTVETLLKEAQLLSQVEQLRLASLLIQQAQSAIPTDEERRAAFRRVRGKFKNILMSTEEFQAERRRELELEEQRYAEHFGQHPEKSE